MKGTHILAIDEGTTGTTALIFDHDGAIKGRAYSEFPQHFPKPGWVEHDANEIWSVTIKVIGEALENARIKASDLAAIGITNQRETSVMWHRKNGKPAANAIVWQDRRTASLCGELRSEGLEPAWQEKTGLLLDPYFSGTKVHWLLENVKGLKKAAQKGDVAFGTIDSWLVWKLTGGVCHITDVSNASRTLLYNIRKLEWDAEILARLGIPASVLPKVMPSSCVYGETDPAVFFGERIPIAGIAGDQQAALFGQACYQEGAAKNTYGTGSFLLMNTGSKPVLSKERLLTTIAWRLGDEPVQYALEGSIFITGAAVQWLRDGLGIIAHAAETEALARSVPDNGDVYFVPALAGLGAPYWDPYARGLIAGITRGTTRAHICRATLESICYQTRDVVEAMGRESGIPSKSLRADGGAVGNSFLMQFQADILGVPVEVPSIAETTGLGAAYLAGLAVGFWKDKSEVAQKRKVSRVFEPAMKDDERSWKYLRWCQAVKRAMGWAIRGKDEG